MSTGARVLLVLVAYPATEIVVAIAVASVIGWYWVFVAVVLGMLLGLIIARLGARATGRSWGAAMQTMQMRQEMGDTSGMPEGASTTAPAQAALLIPAGLLIAVPGFVTDVVGLVMLIPGVRSILAARIARAVERRQLPPNPPYGP